MTWDIRSNKSVCIRKLPLALLLGTTSGGGGIFDRISLVLSLYGYSIVYSMLYRIVFCTVCRRLMFLRD